MELKGGRKTAELNRFFANKPETYQKIHMGGKSLHLANFPMNIRRKVMDKLAKNDSIMAKGQKGILPGIKINGIQVTRDNIHDFEIKPAKAKKPKAKKSIAKKAIKPTYTESQLFALTKKEQVSMLKGMGITKIPRLEKGRVKKILELIGGAE